MPGPLVAGIAGSIGSAAIQGNAAKKAGQAQGAAADAQIAETRRQFDMIQGLLSPYVSAGTAGLQAQLDLMGIGGSAGTAMEIEEFTVPGAAGSAPQAGPLDAFVNGGSGFLSNFANNAVTPSAGGTRFRVGGREFATRAEAEAYANANRTGGISAEDAQRAAISKIENGAQFGQLVKQGEYGLMANASATGGLRGGDTQAALAQFRPQMLQALIDKQLAQYGGLAANGQNAAAMTGTAAQNAGAQVNQALGDRGAAQAGSALAGGQAWGNALAGINQSFGAFGGGFGNAAIFDPLFGGKGLGNLF
jgi:hypothetical protein